MIDDGLRIPPHAADAELSLIAGLLREPFKADEIDLLEDDFYIHQYKVIYSAIRHLADRGKEIDIVTVAEHLDSKGQLSMIGGVSFIGEIVVNSIAGTNVKRYAEIIKDKALLREVITIGVDAVEDAYGLELKGNEVVENIEKKIFNISERRENNEPVDMSVAVMEAMDYLDKQIDGVTYQTTGLTDLDKIIGGLRGGAVYVFAARPSMGKTALMCSIACRVAEDKHCYIATLEMPRREIAARLISMVGKINLNAHSEWQHDDYDRLTYASGKVNGMNITIDHEEGISLAKLRARCRRLKRKKNLGCIFIDYLQLIRTKADNREREIAEISAGLKSMAKELDIPVVVLAQLNRDVDKRADKRPVMSDLRESGAIEQDADVIFMLYRDEVYDKDTQYKGIAEIVGRKNRHGPLGDVFASFDHVTMHFQDKAHDWMMPVKEVQKPSAYNDL